MADDVLEKQLQKRLDQKADIAARSAEKKKKGLTRNNQNALPVMTKADQTRRMHELKALFLKSKKLEPFVKKLFDIAMDDDHDGQMQAMKMVADRILPAAGFSGEEKKSSAVQINITGLQVESIQEKPVDDTPVSIQ
jgi:hypothetical protein